MRQHYWELRGLGVELVAAANDTPETNKELRERLDLPFTLLADQGAEVARAYRALHEGEPQGRVIARSSVFLIDRASGGNRVLWEYVGPSSRHRVAPSRLSEEVQRALGRTRLLVSVVVPSAWQLERTIAAFSDPPLGIYRMPPGEPARGALTMRDYTRELAMQAHAEIHRLTEAGWTLVSVTPEAEGERQTGQRYVFTREV